MLASDMNNPNFLGSANPDSVLDVRFYMRSEQDNYKSDKEGRPIFYEVPYIQIRTPGNQLSEIDTPAREDHKQRFPEHWARFQNSQNPQDQIVGTPVEQWPSINRAEAEELKGIRFFTVEQIAGASDLQMQRLGMNANVLRQKAQAFLAAAKDSAYEQKQAAELARKDEQIAALSKQVAALAEQMAGLGAKPKRKYIRKQKPEDKQEESASA